MGKTLSSTNVRIVALFLMIHGGVWNKQGGTITLSMGEPFYMIELYKVFLWGWGDWLWVLCAICCVMFCFQYMSLLFLRTTPLKKKHILHNIRSRVSKPLKTIPKKMHTVPPAAVITLTPVKDICSVGTLSLYCVLLRSDVNILPNQTEQSFLFLLSYVVYWWPRHAILITSSDLEVLNLILTSTQTRFSNRKLSANDRRFHPLVATLDTLRATATPWYPVCVDNQQKSNIESEGASLNAESANTASLQEYRGRMACISNPPSQVSHALHALGSLGELDNRLSPSHQSACRLDRQSPLNHLKDGEQLVPCSSLIQG